MGFDWGQALNIGGGAARGVLEGQEDLKRKAEFDYLQKKRQYDLEQMQAEKEIGEDTQRRIQEATAAQPSDIDMSGAGMKGGGLDVVDYRRTQQPLPASQQLGIAAQAQLGSRFPKYQLQGAQLAGQSAQLEDIERKSAAAKRQEAVFQEHLPFLKMIDEDPKKFLKEHGEPYYRGKVPDGKHVAYADTADGGLAYTFVDDKTNESSGWHTIAPAEMKQAAGEVLERMVGNKLGTIDKEGFTGRQAYNLELKKLGYKEREVGATERNAATMEAFHGLGGVYHEAAKADREARIKVAEIQAAARSPEEKVAMKKWEAYSAAATRYSELIKDPVRNLAEISRLTMDLAVLHPEGSMVTMTDKDAEGNQTQRQENRFNNLTKQAFAAVGIETTRDGSPLPRGVSSADFVQLQKDAAEKKVKVAAAVRDNTPVIIYTNPKFPGQGFNSLQDAVSGKGGTPSGTPGTPAAPGAPAATTPTAPASTARQVGATVRQNLGASYDSVTGRLKESYGPYVTGATEFTGGLLNTEPSASEPAAPAAAAAPAPQGITPPASAGPPPDTVMPTDADYVRSGYAPQGIAPPAAAAPAAPGPVTRAPPPGGPELVSSASASPAPTAPAPAPEPAPVKPTKTAKAKTPRGKVNRYTILEDQMVEELNDLEDLQKEMKKTPTPALQKKIEAKQKSMDELRQQMKQYVRDNRNT